MSLCPCSFGALVALATACLAFEASAHDEPTSVAELDASGTLMMRTEKQFAVEPPTRMAGDEPPAVMIQRGDEQPGFLDKIKKKIAKKIAGVKEKVKAKVKDAGGAEPAARGDGEGGAESGDLIENQNKIIEEVDKLAKTAEPVFQSYKSTGEKAKAARKAEIDARTKHHTGITGIRNEISSVKGTVHADHQKSKDQVKDIDKDIYALQADVLANRQISLQSADESKKEDDQMKMVQSKLQETISAMEDALEENRNVDKTQFDQATESHAQLIAEMGETKNKLAAQTQDLIKEVRDVEHEVDVNRQESRGHAAAVTADNQAIKVELNEATKALHGEIQTGLSKTSEVKKAIDDHSRSVDDEHESVKAGHVQLEGQIDKTRQGLLAQVQSMQDAVDTVSTDINTGRKRSEVAAKRSEAETLELSNDVGKSQEGMQEILTDIDHLQKNVQSGMFGDRRTIGAISSEIDSVRRGLGSRSEQVHQSIMAAKTAVTEAHDAQRTRAQIAINEDGEIADLLRRAHGLVQTLNIPVPQATMQMNWVSEGDAKEVKKHDPGESAVSGDGEASEDSTGFGNGTASEDSTAASGPGSGEGDDFFFTDTTA